MTRLSQSANDTFGGAARDVADGLRRWRFWLAYGLRDISSSFPGVYGGLIFIPLQTAIVIGAFWLTFNDVLGNTAINYAAYVALGYPLFIFIMGSITSTTSVIKQNANILANMPFPVFAFVMRAVVRLAGSLVLALTIFFAFVLAGRLEVSFSMLAAVPGFVMLLSICVANALTFSLVSLYLPNIVAILRSFSRFALFFTPVIWHPEGSAFRMAMANFNPLSHLIAIVRQPLLNQPVPAESWLVSGAALAFMIVASLLLLKQVRRYIIFRV
jgi:ABC-2 type transport system permease protein